MTTSFDEKRSVTYDDRIVRMVPGYEVVLQLTDIVLGAELPKDARVLIVGAGTVAEVVACGKSHPDWRITAVEPSVEMSKIGRAKTDAAGLSARVEWQETPLKKLSTSEPYDAATLLLVLHFLPDDGGKAALLENIAERLKPGAPLVLSTFVGDPQTTRSKKIYDLCRAWAVAHGVPPEEAAEKISLSRPDVYTISEERIKVLLRNAGFIDVQRIYQALAATAWSARTNR